MVLNLGQKDANFDFFPHQLIEISVSTGPGRLSYSPVWNNILTSSSVQTLLSQLGVLFQDSVEPWRWEE